MMVLRLVNMRLAVIIMIVGIGAAVACGPAAPAPTPTKAPAPVAAPTPTAKAVTVEQPKRGGTIRISTGVEGTQLCLDPQCHTWTTAGTMHLATGDQLIARDPVTYQYLVGGLTTGWKVSDDGLTWTFNLRKGVKYHDGGREFKAADAAASYSRGAKKGIVPRIYSPPDSTYTAADDYTFVITSPKVYGPMLDHLSWGVFFVVTDEEKRAQIGEDKYGRNPGGTGPFKFKEWILGDSMRLVRNDEYNWGPGYLNNKGAPYLDEIFIKFIGEEATINAALLAGELDVAYLPNQFADALAKDPRFDIQERASGSLNGLSPNHGRAPFNDEKVRRALQRAFDRTKVLQVYAAGKGYPQYGQLIRALPCYSQAVEDETAKLLSYDTKAALALLAEAGWQRGADGVLKKDGKAMDLSMIITGAELQVRLGTLTKAALQDLGINVNLETLESATLTSRRNAGTWDLRSSGYGTLTADILSYFWHPIKSDNFDRITDPVFADLLDKARHNLGEERCRANETVVRYFRDHAIHIPFTNPGLNTIINKERAAGVIVHKNSYDWIFNDAWLRK